MRRVGIFFLGYSGSEHDAMAKLLRLSLFFAEPGEFRLSKLVCASFVLVS